MHFDSFPGIPPRPDPLQHVPYSHEAIFLHGWLYGTLGNRICTHCTLSKPHWAALDKVLLGSDRGPISPWCAVFALHLLHSEGDSDQDLNPLHGKNSRHGMKMVLMRLNKKIRQSNVETRLLHAYQGACGESQLQPCGSTEHRGRGSRRGRSSYE